VTRSEAKNVKRYLYSINRLELSVANLKNSIDELQNGDKPYLNAVSYDGINVMGGEQLSIQEKIMNASYRNAARIEVLQGFLSREERKLNAFYNAIEFLNHEGDVGRLASHIVRHKYIQRIQPDERIYQLNLYCTRETFYRAHRMALQFFADVIPELK